MQSDTIVKNAIYAFQDYIRGNFTIENACVTVESIGVDGYVSMPWNGGIIVNEKLNVTGNIALNYVGSITNNGTVTTGNISMICDGRYNVDLTNNGRFEVINNLTAETTNSKKGCRIIQNSDEAELIIGGNFTDNTNDICNTISAGTVRFNGNGEQKIKNLKAYNVIIENPNGITYQTDTYINGLYDTNGYELKLNGFSTIISSTTKFVKGYDYKHLTVKSVITFTETVKATILINTPAYDASFTIKVPENKTANVDGDIYIPWNGKIIVDGELNVTGTISLNYIGSITNNGTVTTGNMYMECDSRNDVDLINNGKFEILNNLTANVTSSTNKYKCRIIQNSDEAELIIGGNFTDNTNGICNTISAGIVRFNGNDEQKIKNLKTPTIILENISVDGVIFSTHISPSRLFNHQGNKFTLNGGGSFVDYDGDSIKDNIDPAPLVYNPVGDADYNGAVNSADLVHIRKILLGVIISNHLQETVADINQDNSFDVRDLVRLKKKLAGIID